VPEDSEASGLSQSHSGRNGSFVPSAPETCGPGKKMQPAGNIGSEPVETSKKGKAGKANATTEGTSKSAKATNVLE
jgi:hypothetical protein